MLRQYIYVVCLILNMSYVLYMWIVKKQSIKVSGTVNILWAAAFYYLAIFEAPIVTFLLAIGIYIEHKDKQIKESPGYKYLRK